jgi:hypothetical protein
MHIYKLYIYSLIYTNMKRIRIALLLIPGFFTMAYTQSVAPNWTHTDCNSTNHNLYSYLDSQEVVVMEFVMGCSSCTDAGIQLMSLKNQYDVSHPGKVNFFLMDYYPSNTCVEVTNTWGAYNFDAYFSGCWAEKEVYYPTLYPMPAIVVAAGNYHTVIYNDLSWQTSDTTLIKQVIDQFFNTVGISETHDSKPLLFPNPCSDEIQISYDNVGYGLQKVTLYDLHGQLVLPFEYETNLKGIIVNLHELSPGSYILEMQIDNRIIRKIVIKN